MKMFTNRMIHLQKERVNRLKGILSPYRVCGYLIICFVTSAHAGDWIISPGVGIEQIYTDNAFLTSENEESDTISVVRPTISIYKEGARASLDLNYAPEYRHYWDETEDNDVVHFLRTEGNVELVENHLFLDGWLRADRTNITSSGRTGINGLTGTADDTDFYSVGLSPYYTARLGSIAVLEARYTGDSVDYAEDSQSDSVGNRVDIAFGSGSSFTNQIWEVLAQHTVVDYDNLDDDNETTIFRAELIQQLTHQWALTFAAGYEEYNLAVTQDSDDAIWSLGAIYTPNPGTRVAIGFGERTFGDDYYLDFSHRSSRTIWTASYEQDFVSAREEVSNLPLFQRQDEFGNLVRDPILDSPPSLTRTAFTPSLTEDFYETKRFVTGFTYQTLRSSMRLRGGYYERIYDRSGRDTEDLELGLTFTRRLSRLMNGLFQIAFVDHEEDVLIYDQWTASLGLNYQIGNDSRIALGLTHLERDADVDLLSYEENHASIRFTTLF
ncbi:MAG: TIGR03016 family PEP-CTERM system-associated outer membrane protein [Candidatus Thiodiazotropha sp. (ex. Lucinoma kazani)]